MSAPNDLVVFTQYVFDLLSRLWNVVSNNFVFAFPFLLVFVGLAVSILCKFNSGSIEKGDNSGV